MIHDRHAKHVNLNNGLLYDVYKNYRSLLLVTFDVFSLRKVKKTSGELAFQKSRRIKW